MNHTRFILNWMAGNDHPSYHGFFCNLQESISIIFEDALFNFHAASTAIQRGCGARSLASKALSALTDLRANNRPSAFVFVTYSVALASTVIAIRKIATAHCHLRQFAGPRWAAYSRLWLCKTIASGNLSEILVDVNTQYGPIARIGPNHLVTSDPELSRKILAVGSKWRRGPWFDAIRIDPRVSNIVSERDIQHHNRLRQRMSFGYAGKDIQGLETAVDERIDEFISAIEKRWLSVPGKTTPLDIARRLQFLTLDIITHLCFGKPIGFVQSDTDKYNFIATIEAQLPIVQHFSVILVLNSIFRLVSSVPVLRRLVVPSANDRSGVGIIMKASCIKLHEFDGNEVHPTDRCYGIQLSREVINDRLKTPENQQTDMLGSFMKRGLTPDEAEMEVSISLVAGSDTTATAMRATLLAVISTPTVYSRLQKEIDQAEARGLLSSPAKNSEAIQLPYLQAVIREGLRRFPPITNLREQESPPEGIRLSDGRFIPGGVYVGFNAWGTQLNSVFGEDAYVFRPERWLPESYDDGGQQILAMGKVHELIFGYGATRCLGIPIAMMNLNKVFIELFRRYDIQCINHQKPWTSICYGIFFQRDFNVRISRRILPAP